MTNDPSTLDDLLRCEGEHFIRHAYRIILGRYPDPGGLAYYFGRLEKGYPKIQILAQLKLSREASGKDGDLPGLSAAIKQYKWSRYPVIGRFFNLAAPVNATAQSARQGAREPGITTTKEDCLARMTELESRLARIINARVDAIETLLVDLQAATTQQANDLASRIEAALPSVQALSVPSDGVLHGMGQDESQRAVVAARHHFPPGLLAPGIDYEATRQVQPYPSKIFSQLKFQVTRHLERVDSADRH